MKELIIAIGLLLLLEGALYGGFPFQLKKYAALIAQMPEKQIQSAGIVVMLIGALIIWLCIV